MLVERGDNVIPDARPHPVNHACSLFLEPFGPLSGSAAVIVDSWEKGRESPDSVPSLSPRWQSNISDLPFLRYGSVRRTFCDIVLKYLWANGRVRFAVRELCKMMRINAASLTEAQENPGRLLLNSVVALTKVMEENPLNVIANFLAETGAKKTRKK